MKKILLIILFITSSLISYSQFWGGVQCNFDTSNLRNPMYQFYFDTTLHAQNKWQIGHPNKTIFDSAYSNPNALLTDTIFKVPASDTSIFYVKQAFFFSPFNLNYRLKFKYKMDGDINDFGKIEVFSQKDLAWIDILKQDKSYNISYPLFKPNLSGATMGWKNFYADFSKSLFFDNTGFIRDTIFLKFTYITDSSTTLHDGWMIDDFFIQDDWYWGFDKIAQNKEVVIFPNPADNVITITGENLIENAKINIYNPLGQIILELRNNKSNTINTSELPLGLYTLKYYDKEKNFSKKFMVIH